MKIAIALIAIASMTTSAFAEGNKNINNSYSQSYSQSRSSSRSTGGNASANNAGNTQTTNFRDRLQAPGMGVGGGYCADGLSISGPGFGFGFTTQARMCKTEMGARIAKTYLGAPSAVQYVCSQYDFKNLTACQPRRR